MDKLLPCPFCGGEAMLFRDDEGWHGVRCADKKCIGADIEARWAGAEDAIEQWNTRTRDAEVEALKETISRIHASLDLAEKCRAKATNYSELAIANGLALGQIAVVIGHEYEDGAKEGRENG